MDSQRSCLPSHSRPPDPNDACVHRSLRSLQCPNLGWLEQSKRRQADLFAMRPRQFFGKPVRGSDVRFGSKADICGATSHVRFAPNCDRKSGYLRFVMSALPPKADMCSAAVHVRFGRLADITLFVRSACRRAIYCAGETRGFPFSTT
jgi:hypothetical protein